MTMSYFGNDKYKVLNCIFSRQITVAEETVTKLSQEEISTIVGISKVKVNSIISELKKDNYLKNNTPKGKYILTDIANQELKQMKHEEV